MLPKPAGADIFDQLKKHEILLHHPFQSFQPVVDFICAAARDPDVVAIKQTIYRTGTHSELMEALMAAARAGKEVTVILELMARFDEEANINWADKLEQAGAQVVYGVVGLKTHAKIALVIRREEGGLQFYSHLGTGNYHLTTTRLYTDFGLLTAHQEIGEEVNEVFIHLTSLSKPQKLKHLWLAPFTLQNEIIRAIRNEARIARAGRPGRIIAKVNALVDESVIRALYAASQDGVKIDLIVRGACTLRPGRAGAVGEHQGALDHRALPRAQPHLLLPQRPGARRLPGQRRLDEPQPVPPHRGGVPGAGQGAQAARDRRRTEPLPEGQLERVGTGAGRPVPAAPRARQADRVFGPATT